MKQNVLKKFKLIIYSLIQYTTVLFLGWFYNRLLETLIIIPLFFYMRSQYTKTFHARTSLECTFFTIIMFYVLDELSLPVGTSILFIIVITYITVEILYHLSEYLDLIKVKKFKIYRGMNKDILIKKCELNNLSDIETQILVSYYCDKLKRWQIGNMLNYSEDRISQIKKEALDKLV